MNQFRRMGASLDYRRERFTMDDGYVRAVMRFFVHLYDKGWIYRDNRIINWCPYHQTSLSDLELVHDETSTTRSRRSATRSPTATATSRSRPCGPATIPADVAVAVHPDDERYRRSRRQGGDRAVRRAARAGDRRRAGRARSSAPARSRSRPGHDPKDFEIGRDHGLPEPMCIGPDGLDDRTRASSRARRRRRRTQRILDWCRERGLLEKREHYRHAVALCERCEIADRAADLAPVVVLDGGARSSRRSRRCARGASSTTRSPSTASRSTRSRRRPTGASRGSSGGATRSRSGTAPTATSPRAERAAGACAECGSAELTRETDVLDTWFSSALWPFATLGWPDETADLKAFYPGDLQTTAREIIRLWENRMIFSGLELLGEVPFTRRDHPLDRARARRPADVEVARHGIDPLDVDRRARHRRDALRPAEDLARRRTCASRTAAIEEGAQAREQALERGAAAAPRGRRRRATARPASRRGALDPGAARRRRSARSRRCLAEFDFAHAVDELYHVTFDDFCDWYLEAIKPRLYDGDADARRDRARARSSGC